MIKYKHKFLKIQEIWFDNTQVVDDVDKVIYQQVQSKIDDSFEEFYTLCIDLTKDEKEILKKIKKNFKYEINRSKNKDKLTFNIYYNGIDDSVIEQFVEYYNKFSNKRGLSKLPLNIFKEYAKNKNLMIAAMSDKCENILSCHIYIVVKKRIRLKVSSSFFKDKDNETRNLIGRANKRLHIEVIEYCKNNGFETYDFGGWYNGHEDRKKLGINKFKESFGGEQEVSYNGEVCLTLKCKIHYLLAKIKKTMRG
jgi:lipid II:glycine glycyltransferase (peptidoglycan interpeptide bridge formation enzyme)